MHQHRTTTLSHTACAAILHRAWLQDRSISAEVSWDQISEEVNSGRVVILKGAYEQDRMLRFREAIIRWGVEHAPMPHGQSPSLLPDLNYHRIDDGVIQSVCPHVFHQYGFKSIDRLDDYLRGEAEEVAKTMKDLQNLIAQTSFDISLNDLYLKILHYPSGAGFLAEHQHPLQPQRVGLITSLSRMDVDVVKGGTTFKTPFGLVDVAKDHDIGDIVLFRYDLPHAVPLVDPGQELEWQSHAGKWSAVIELRQTHALSHKS